MQKNHVTCFTIILIATLGASACKKPILTSSTKNETLDDDSVLDLGALGLTNKVRSNTLQVCLIIERPANTAGEANTANQGDPADFPLVSIQGKGNSENTTDTTPKTNMPVGSGSGKSNGSNPSNASHAQADLTDDFIKASLTKAGNSWLDALRQKFPNEGITNTLTVVQITDLSQCTSAYDALITVKAGMGRPHVFPAPFPRMNLELRRDSLQGQTREEDFYNVALHEFGHTFGLGDLYVEGVARCKPGQPSQSVMCGADGKYSSLQPDDIDGIVKAYNKIFHGPTFDTGQRPNVEALMAMTQELKQYSAQADQAEEKLAEMKRQLYEAIPISERKSANFENDSDNDKLREERVSLSKERQDLSTKIKDIKSKAEFDKLYAQFIATSDRIDTIESTLNDKTVEKLLVRLQSSNPDLVQAYLDAEKSLSDTNVKINELNQKIWDWDRLSVGNINPFAK